MHGKGCTCSPLYDTDVSTIPAPSDGDFPPIWAILLIGKIGKQYEVVVLWEKDYSSLSYQRRVAPYFDIALLFVLASPASAAAPPED